MDEREFLVVQNSVGVAANFYGIRGQCDTARRSRAFDLLCASSLLSFCAVGGRRDGVDSHGSSRRRAPRDACNRIHGGGGSLFGCRFSAGFAGLNRRRILGGFGRSIHLKTRRSTAGRVTPLERSLADAVAGEHRRRRGRKRL